MGMFDLQEKWVSRYNSYSNKTDHTDFSFGHLWIHNFNMNTVVSKETCTLVYKSMPSPHIHFLKEVSLY